MKKSVCVLCSLVFSASLLGSQQSDFPKLTGPYLGQKPPGKTPEYFAPGIITVDANFEHSAAVFSPDGKEVFWCTNVDAYTDRRVEGGLRLHFMKVIEGLWAAPRVAPFVKDLYVERPVFSPDGNRLFIEFGRDPARESDFDIYVVERTADGWSVPRPVSPLINSPAMERLHCVTADGSLYFSRDPFTRNEEIFVSSIVNGEFGEPKKLGKDYNSDVYEAAILIEPYEKYMLICQLNTQHTASDLSISYKKPDNTWSERIKTPYYSGGFLALSPDGKYLFMENEGITWVDTSFVEELRPRDLK
jgi:hypothetical protein